MSFLPNDYAAPPKDSHYMKINQGDNKFRILSKPILGWEDWTPDKKPVRYKYTPKPPKAIVESRPPKHFWSFIVWNYEDERIQILHIPQATIRDSLHSLTMDEDWGAPFFYDIKISKSGEDTKTKYVVSPLPHKPLAAHIKASFYDNPCCLEALFDNGKPFDQSSGRMPTKGIFGPEDLAEPRAFIGPVDELKEVLSLDGISTEHLMEYLTLKAKEKSVTVEQVVSSAMLKEFQTKFKNAYGKWLFDTKNIEEAVPF